MSAGRQLVALLALALFGCGVGTANPLVGPQIAWLIAGQSNAVGHGPYSGTFPGDVNVTYMVDSTITPFAPNPNSISPGGVNTNGCELGIGPTVTAANPGQKVSISKAATDSLTIAQLSVGTPWGRTVDGIRRLNTVASVLHYVWIQGESDASTNRTQAQYFADLTAYAAQVRANFTGTVKFYIVLLNSASPWGGTTPDIRAAELQFVAADSNAVSYDANAVGAPNLGFHYDSTQEITIGQSVAAL